MKTAVAAVTGVEFVPAFICIHLHSWALPLKNLHITYPTPLNARQTKRHEVINKTKGFVYRNKGRLKTTFACMTC